MHNVSFPCLINCLYLLEVLALAGVLHAADNAEPLLLLQAVFLLFVCGKQRVQ